ncbi:MAG: HesA/MoeB/ThiF family protein [Gallionella sp.]|nr:HesA/MoeB/ThiF family protein [Gallionella sp.]MDD5611611.1 HesA/MoeB/ThiF family protein [Gallionella sp.]
MNDEQLERYGRHILLSEIGIEGQQSLINATALIIGLGGLGSPAALYLAASGVGRLILCDHDTVDLSNLQRQIAHRNTTIGLPKVDSAKAAIHELNPEILCTCISHRIDENNLHNLVAKADVVLDCSDNFATRYSVNHICRKLRKPLVSGAAILFSGQASVFDFRQDETPCYNCLFPCDGHSEELRCATTGVFSPLTGIIGAIQAAEAIKLLAGLKDGLNSRLLSIDALKMSIRTSTLAKDPTCNVCNHL